MLPDVQYIHNIFIQFSDHPLYLLGWHPNRRTSLLHPFSSDAFLVFDSC